MKYKEYNTELITSLFTAITSNSKYTTLENLSTIIKASDATNLDLMYLAHSGNKYVSSILNYLKDENITPEARANLIADVLLIKFGKNWDRMAYTLNLDYNPINNYDMTEHESVNVGIENSSSNSIKRYGFNTPADSPVGDTDNSTSSSTTGLAKDNYKDITRSGNIGVTTSADLASGELLLRSKNLLDMIFKDIDTVLCLKVY